MQTYTAIATRDGNWWTIIIQAGDREIATQAKGLDRAEEIAREAVAMALDVDEDSFEIDVVPELSPDLENIISTARKASEASEQVQAEASLRARGAVWRLKAEGYTVRDTGKLLKLSPQRISQLLAMPVQDFERIKKDLAELGADAQLPHPLHAARAEAVLKSI